MSEKKNIERLFQEKFKDFEAVPSPQVWNNIEAQLNKKKKRRVVPIWFRLSGVAALLLIGALIGVEVWNGALENNTKNGVVNQEKNDLQKDSGKDLIPTKNPIKSNEIVTDAEDSKNVNPKSSQTDFSSETNNSENYPVRNQKTSLNDISVGNQNKNNAIANSPKTKTNSIKNTITNLSQENASIANSERKSNRNQNTKTIVSNAAELKNDALAVPQNLNSKENQNKTPTSESRKNNNAIAENKITSEEEINKTQIAFDTKALEKQKKDSTAVATVVPNPLEELLLQQEKEKQAVTETKVNRWQITSNVAPIYFSSASNGSPISQEFADNNKNYEKNISYGVGLNYSFSNKWSVRGGINKLTLGYNTNNIVYYAGLPEDTARGVSSSNSFKSDSATIIVEDNSAVNVLSFDNVPGKIPGHLNQTMGYIEVPLELSYKILDRKFGIELIGGMSTMFLNENNLSVVSSGMSSSIGEAENLNDISFTSNIGLGFKYKFWNSFQANLEPKLKYQINTFSENAGGFKPYFIGIYSGLSFSF